MMEPEALYEYLCAIRDDEVLSSLVITNVTNEYTGSVRGACFENPVTGDHTVAFRGTGGSYEQWYYNFRPNW